jgi:hypothetical protein
MLAGAFVGGPGEALGNHRAAVCQSLALAGTNASRSGHAIRVRHGLWLSLSGAAYRGRRICRNCRVLSYCRARQFLFEEGIKSQNRSCGMVNVPSGPSADNAASRRSERFRGYLLLVLGIAFLGAAITMIGLASSSPATVAMGAGAIAAAGLISIFFAVVCLRLSTKTDGNISLEDSASSNHDMHTGDTWPSKTSRRFPID